ncbi:MAG: nucleoside recognition protein [Deltaproteobacteria bacterium]|nr:nucleoside recognition protein [Deltaproteobacteria bacterium]MBW2137397.1 nucleoside recognition protein [Deltaproteobacteria bacterium]
MKDKAKRHPYALYALLGITLVLIIMSRVSGQGPGPSVDPEFLWGRLARPLIRLTFFISMGLFVGQIIEATGWTNKVTVMARPFMRWGHLTSQMGAAFTTAFFSGTASLSMVVAFYGEGRASKREVTLSVLLNSFPTYFVHLPTTFFVLLPLVGKAGLVYLLVTLGAAILRLVSVLAYSHFKLPPAVSVYQEDPGTRKHWKTVFSETSKKFAARIRRILLIVLPVYLVIAMASHAGFFLWLRRSAAGLFTSDLIPVEAMSVVIFTLVAEFTSGYAAAGAMLDSGALTLSQTVLALLAGNIMAAPIRALRHQMPYYMGIFRPGTGIRLMVLTQAFRVGSLLVAGALYVLFMGIIGV